MKIPLSLEWKSDLLYVLDQTQLPQELSYLPLSKVEDVWDAIKKLKVRGAPAISIAGAYGFYLGLKKYSHLNYDQFLIKAQDIFDYLNSSRPTAVNLQFALRRMLNCVKIQSQDTAKILELLLQEAHAIYQQDLKICTAIGEHALPLIKEGMGILTHCNAGSIAVSKWGTALAPMHMARIKGVNFTVYVDETRPLLQGSRLTAWELMQSDIDVRLITDNMAAWMMAQGKISMIIVGADRVVRNGDVCNKIGTLGVAILAKHFKIPFYVACPTTTIDLETKQGSDIHIEERSAEEVTHLKDIRIAPLGVKVENPAFDVTPHELVSGLITENGILTYPFNEKLFHEKK